MGRKRTSHLVVNAYPPGSRSVAPPESGLSLRRTPLAALAANAAAAAASATVGRQVSTVLARRRVLLSTVLCLTRPVPLQTAPFLRCGLQLS